MEPTIAVAAIGSVPATLAAIAGIIAARRSGAGNAAIEGMRAEIRDLDEKISGHVANRRLHRG